MSYEINVSKNGRHYFATADRSLSTATLDQALEMVSHFETVFPAADGYKVELTQIKTIGHKIDPAKIVQICNWYEGIYTITDKEGIAVKCGFNDEATFGSYNEAKSAAEYSGYFVK